jgi:capsular exopolysaccharide synthesis family protein
MERLLRVPGLAVIPQIASARRLAPLRLAGQGTNGNGRRALTGGSRDLIASTQVYSSGAEAYRTLRTNLIFSQAVQSLKTVMVTSARKGEGRTTVASNLAVTFAQQGMRVLLVDCDLRHPKLHTIFDLPRQPGVTQLVLDQADVGEVIRETSLEGLFLVPAGASPTTNPSDLLGSVRMGEVLEELGADFDIVLLDTPPLLATTAGTAVLGRQADGVLLVVRAGHTNREAAQDALQQLNAVGARVVGAVLNDSDVRMEEYRVERESEMVTHSPRQTAV